MVNKTKATEDIIDRMEDYRFVGTDSAEEIYWACWRQIVKRAKAGDEVAIEHLTEEYGWTK